MTEHEFKEKWLEWAKYMPKKEDRWYYKVPIIGKRILKKHRYMYYAKDKYNMFNDITSVIDSKSDIFLDNCEFFNSFVE